MGASRCSTRLSRFTTPRRMRLPVGPPEEAAMSEDLQFAFALVLSGASIGLMYSLIALGFVLVYKATDAINFAQGEFVMMSGLIAAAILAVEGVPLIAAIGATFAVMIAF